MASLCPDCGGKRDDGYIYCSKCRNKRTEYRHFLEAHRICPKCKREMLYGNEKNCVMCRANAAQYAYDRRHRDERIKAYYNEVARKSHEKRAQKLLEDGKCVYCGKRQVKNVGGRCCSICLTRRNAHQRRKLSELTGRPDRSLWVEIGLCYRCGKPNDNAPKKVCKSCIERSSGRNFDGHRKTDHWDKANNLIFKKVKVGNE